MCPDLSVGSRGCLPGPDDDARSLSYPRYWQTLFAALNNGARGKLFTEHHPRCHFTHNVNLVFKELSIHNLQYTSLREQIVHAYRTTIFNYKSITLTLLAL